MAKRKQQPSKGAAAIYCCIGCGRDTTSTTRLCWECRGKTRDRHHTEGLDRHVWLSSAVLGGQPDSGESNFFEYADTDEPTSEEEQA